MARGPSAAIPAAPTSPRVASVEGAQAPDHLRADVAHAQHPDRASPEVVLIGSPTRCLATFAPGLLEPTQVRRRDLGHRDGVSELDCDTHNDGVRGPPAAWAASAG